MHEEILHYIWQYQKFDSNNLKTTEGVPLSILSTGKGNDSQGPDFLNAKIKIGEITLAGNVEIHIQSSDFFKHNHQHDPNYQNIILHVVLQDDDDKNDFFKDKNIPTLELAAIVSEKLLHSYEQLLGTKKWIPCQHFIPDMHRLPLNMWLQRLGVERLENKTKTILDDWENKGRNLEQSFFESLCRYLGVSKNKDSMMHLAKCTPLQLLNKYSDNIFMLEALLFGQAGMLEQNIEEDYFLMLKKEYTFLQKKHQLKTILKESSWNYKCRPPAFPTIRIAQLAAILFKNKSFFDSCVNLHRLSQLEKILIHEPSPYWRKHYQFGKQGKNKNGAIGKMLIQIISINTVIPFIFAYGRSIADEKYEQRAADFLEKIPSEKNAIIKKFNQIGIETNSAADSQALIQLKTLYCDLRKCIRCTIGQKLLENSTYV